MIKDDLKIGYIEKTGMAKHMLAEARTMADLKNIRDISESARVYAKAAKLGLGSQNEAAEIKIRAERKAGELLKQLPKNEGVRGRIQEHLTGVITNPLPSDIPTYADLGIKKQEAQRYQTMAELPECEFLDHIANINARHEELTSKGVFELSSVYKKREYRSKVARESQGIELPNTVSLIHGDFKVIMADMAENSIDMIFTDPPYDAESIPLYGDLARLSARVLKPGGSLMVYVGHYALPGIFDVMEKHLRYWWICAVKHSGGNARLPGKWVIAEWKPLLWFVKDKRGGNELVADFVKSDIPTKKEHDWQQGTEEANYYIRHLTAVGDVVLDPFAGSGTTLLVAHNLNRCAIGIEKELETYGIAKHYIDSKCDKSITSKVE